MLLENYEEEKIADWVRCSPADLYFKRNPRVIILLIEFKLQYLSLFGF